MRRLPIRARLVAAFALVMATVLGGTGLFLYHRVAADLDRTLDRELDARVAGAVAIIRDDGDDLGHPRFDPLDRIDPEGVVQVLETETGEVAGGVGALLLASLAGYGVAAGALAPVESMRRRAKLISGSAPGQRLPVPPARDEIARLGETLNEMLERLEAAHERERRFVGDASHELRTPLSILKAELDLALRSGRSREELEAALRSAGQETDRLIALAEDLLVLARAEDGRLALRLGAVDVGELLAGVRERFAMAPRSRGARSSSRRPLRWRSRAIGRGWSRRSATWSRTHSTTAREPSGCPRWPRGSARGCTSAMADRASPRASSTRRSSASPAGRPDAGVVAPGWDCRSWTRSLERTGGARTRATASRAVPTCG